MASTKPMVLVIPGAWHPPIAYAPILDALGISALDADVATLPSFNPRDHFTPACTADAKAVREKILSLLDDATRDVLLLIHSYGGIPAGGAAHGLSKRARAREGKTTGVVGLIYMAAFVVPEGQTLKDFLGGRHAPYVVQNSVRHSTLRSGCSTNFPWSFIAFDGPLCTYWCKERLLQRPHRLCCRLPRRIAATAFTNRIRIGSTSSRLGRTGLRREARLLAVHARPSVADFRARYVH